MVDDIIVGRHTSYRQPLQGPSHTKKPFTCVTVGQPADTNKPSTCATVGQPTGTKKPFTRASVGQPTGTNDYSNMWNNFTNNVTDFNSGILPDEDQIMVNLPLGGIQTKEQAALEAFAATTTDAFEVYA